MFLVGAYVTYWLVRLAVTHGMADALRKDRLERAELNELQQTSAPRNP